ncbi:MAG TPA: ABC transporter permease [Bacteroidales bacterium]|nr:ABC transporter permease [Bacteroidales bacterium]
MLRFIVRRLWYGILVLLGVITVVFLLFNVLPGDPARMVLGQRSDISTEVAIRKDLGLDKPLITQYFNFLNDVSPVSFHQGTDPSHYWFLDSTRYCPYLKVADLANGWTLVLKKPYLRRSYQSKREVTDILAEAFPKTLLLAVVSISFAIVAGIAIGILCAVKKNTLIDRVFLVLSVLGMSLPSFFAAILVAWIFSFVLADFTGLNMFGSMYSVDDFGQGEYLDLKNLILPAFTLGIRPLAVIVELTRSSLLEVLSQDYIRTARAKGLPGNRIIWNHALRNAMNPVATAVTGWFASLMAGAVFVEYVFDWKGIGVVIVDSLEKYDFPVLMGAVLLISVILVFINIFADILYGYLDPRIRYE